MPVRLPRAPRTNRWLALTSPMYDESVAEWTRNEKLMFGGRHVVDDELILFDWEEQNGDRATARRDSAVYVNYPDRATDITVGHIFRQRPTPEDTLDFGGLGEVSRKRDRARPTPAELIYYNADGLGNDGSQWDSYWQSVAKMAMVTGHRWVYVEGPPSAPRNRRDELNGLRPYLTDFSPRAVLNHHYENGRLVFAVIQRSVRKPRIVRGVFQGNEPTVEYLLLTREGFTDFGPAYGEGGWFIFDEAGDLQDFEVGWDATDGDIPLVPLYYDRMRPQVNMNKMSRSGTTEIGNAAVLLMNLNSAASFDLWDSASSVVALAGIDHEGYNLFMSIVQAGSRYAPMATNEDTKQTPRAEDISTGAAVASAFNDRIKQTQDTVVELMLNEINVSPDASGSARRVSWTDVRAPRLAAFASNIETAQNSILPWLEGMWGERARSASVAWKREFDLIDPQASAALFFEMERTAGVSSATLKRKIIVQVAKSIGFLGDDAEQATVEAEYDASAKEAADRAAQLGAMLTQPAGTPRTSVGNTDGRRRQNRGSRPPASNIAT